MALLLMPEAPINYYGFKPFSYLLPELFSKKLPVKFDSTTTPASSYAPSMIFGLLGLSNIPLPFGSTAESPKLLSSIENSLGTTYH